MPEGPEVKRYMDVVRNLRGWTITEYNLIGHAFTKQDHELWDDMIGCQLYDTFTHGKRFALRFTPDMAIVGHLSMTGSFLIDNKEWDTHPHLRMSLRFENPSAVGERGEEVMYLNYIDMRGWGSMEPTLDDWVETHKHIAKLGPDPLKWGQPEWRQQMVPKLFDIFRAYPNKTFSEAIMDQELVAGVGNIYRSEILNRHYIHPELEIQSIPDKQLRDSCDSIQMVLWHAYRAGKTFPRRIYKAEECWLCSTSKRTTAIQTLKQGGRTVWFCPHCQALDRFEKKE
jgi:formamidopyrimidine-DNA glycosylase